MRLEVNTSCEYQCVRKGGERERERESVSHKIFSLVLLRLQMVVCFYVPIAVSSKVVMLAARLISVKPLIFKHTSTPLAPSLTFNNCSTKLTCTTVRVSKQIQSHDSNVISLPCSPSLSLKMMDVYCMLLANPETLILFGSLD